jgi:beta-N-acetylglucosaminidase
MIEVLSMCSKLKIQFIAYLLIMTLLLTMDMSFETKNNNYADASPNLSLETNLITNFITLPLSKPPSMNDPNITINNNDEAVQNTIQTIKKELTNTVPEAAKYEVTSYYLNIRLNASVTSKILKVVPKGTMLEILNTTDQGWLNLKSGGYVNGKYAKLYVNDKYAKLMDRDFKQSVQVKSLSVPSQLTVDKDIGGALSKPTSFVKSDSGLIVAHLEKLFKGTSLAGHGLEQAIIEMEEEYGINAYFTIAVMKLESANGNSSLSKNKNNLFGLNAIDGDKNNKAFSFKTKVDSVRKFGQLISNNYLGKGYTTIEKVSKKYCSANSKWSSLVISIMNNDYRKLI